MIPHFVTAPLNIEICGSIINVVVLMKIKATTFIFLRTKKHDKFLIKY